MRPEMNTPRRPTQSPSRPKNNSKPPKTSAYAVSTHWDPLVENSIERRIDGNAMLTIVVSTTAKNDAAHNTANAVRGRARSILDALTVSTTMPG
jgi:hypothetical protein